MTTFIIIFAITFLVYIIIYEGINLRQRDEVQRKNFDLAKKWESVRHGWGAVIRVGAVVLMVPLFWGDWLELIKWTLVMGCISWILYDMGLNLFRGLSILYKGTEQTSTGSTLDRILHSKILYWGLKGILLVGTIIYIIILS